MKILTSISINC